MSAKKFKTAVLVDRSHKKYPVKADFKGISLSTSIHETVKVHFEDGQRPGGINLNVLTISVDNLFERASL